MLSPSFEPFHNAPNAPNLALVEQLIQPETELERYITHDADWLQGAFWGRPRPGHPEGKVLYHVAEVLANVERCQVSSLMRRRLRLISLCHDAFKYREDATRPRRDWSLHHGVLAANFLKQCCEDQAVILVTEVHDEAYYVWRGLQCQGLKAQSKALLRLEQLFKRLGDDLELFYYFFFCDTLTGDKDLSPLYWFEDLLQKPAPLPLG